MHINFMIDTTDRWVWKCMRMLHVHVLWSVCD